jgi:hypothetical protein
MARVVEEAPGTLDGYAVTVMDVLEGDQLITLEYWAKLPCQDWLAHMYR